MARQFAQQFYKSKKWADKRAYILMRDRYKCVLCGSAKDLEVHHKVHLSPDNIGDYDVALNESNLITLCRECHFAEHKQDRINANKKGDCDEEFYFDENGMLQRVLPANN